MRNVKFDQTRLLATKGLSAAAGKPTDEPGLAVSKLLSTKGLSAAAGKPLVDLDTAFLLSTKGLTAAVGKPG